MYRIGQVAAELDISPVTVRRLSERFATWLSEEAGAPGKHENGRHHARTFTDEDIALLRTIQHLKQGGASEEEVDRYLQERQDAPPAPLAVMEQESNEELMTRTAAAALGQALNQLSETQQAQRELLSVVLADAMGLKDENDRLRKRLRVMEEEMARLKESDWNHRRTLEERMSQLERDQQEKRSWWDRLRGR